MNNKAKFQAWLTSFQNRQHSIPLNWCLGLLRNMIGICANPRAMRSSQMCLANGLISNYLSHGKMMLKRWL